MSRKFRPILGDPDPEGFPLVFVYWTDAVGVTDPFTDMTDLQKGETCLMGSVGLLIKETKDSLIILPHFEMELDLDDKDDEGGGYGEMVIPRTGVRKVVVLRRKVKLTRGRRTKGKNSKR